jgi:muramoyltetrapeptide carboxypeptidase
MRASRCVHVVAPAGPVDLKRVETVCAFLRRHSFQVKLGQHVGAVFGHLAGTDEERAQDLMQAFLDPDCDFIWSLRGGFGCARLLRLLDWQALRRCKEGLGLPTLIGYSDLTSLQQALWHLLGHPSWHAPMLATECHEPIDEITERSLNWMLHGELHSPVRSSQSFVGFEHLSSYSSLEISTFQLHLQSDDVLIAGEADGILLGGNLSVLTSLLGSPYFPSMKRAILALEDYGEYPFRLDRHFTQLANAGVLGDVKGVLLGHFDACEEPDQEKSTSSVQALFTQHLAGLGIPVVRVPFGHAAPRLSLALGARCRIKAV